MEEDSSKTNIWRRFCVISFSFLVFLLLFTSTYNSVSDSENSNTDNELPWIDRIGSILNKDKIDANRKQGSESIELYFFYNPGCGECIVANNTINGFLALYPDINYISVKIYMGNATADQLGRDFFSLDIVPYPTAVFVTETCHYVLQDNLITVSNLESVYNQLLANPENCQGWVYFGEFNAWVAFLSGLLSGLSPCVILITGFFGTSLFTTQNKKMFVLSMVLFILGVLSAYFLLGIVFTYFVQFAVSFFSSIFIKLVIGIPLLVLGTWYIIDSFNENSKLFNTPDKLKKFFSKLSLERSTFASFVLGFIFTILKSPCVAGVMLSLLFSMMSSGLNVVFAIPVLLIFAIGVALPILIVFLALRLGVQNEKINQKRLKYRPYLRIASGIIIIITTLVSIL
jgi:cytochrome c-type biogenesis protein